MPFVAAYVGGAIAFAWWCSIARIPNDAHTHGESGGAGGVDEAKRARALLGWIFVAGLVARLIQLTAAPILEVDFNRYLFDGAMSANGYNPYALSPQDIANLPYNDRRAELARSGGEAFASISYPMLKTIYPPVAQAAFTLAHWLEPWSLTAWRLVVLGGDLATFALLVALLRELRQPAALVAFYWWNPLALKELANSAHLEAVLLPLALAAVLATLRRRPVLGAAALGLAIGVKLWPILLAPVLFRPWLTRWRTLLAIASVLGGLIVLQAWPVARGGLDPSSGFVAFAQHWATNSAHMPLLDALVRAVTAWPASDPRAGLAARGLVGGALLAIVACAAAKPWQSGRDLIMRIYLVVAALVVTSPAQFPWYVLWVLPFAVLARAHVWHVAAALVSLYYVAFHLAEIGRPELHRGLVVWVIWVPIWLLLARDVWRWRHLSKRRSPAV